MVEAPFLDKAREALKAAQLLLEQGCLSSAANRAYYAVFHGLRAALIAAQISAANQKWSHEAIQGALYQLTRRKKVYPAHFGGDLALLRTVRQMADYEPHAVSLRVARDAVKRATLFVTLVEKEIRP